MLPATVQPLAEPVCIEDIYVDTLGGIDDAGDGNIRFTFCAKQVASYDQTSVETVIRVRLVTGPTLIWLTIRATLAHFRLRCCETFLRCGFLH